MHSLEYQNTIRPVKKFRLYFVVKHFGFIDIFRSSRLDVSNDSDNNAYKYGRKNVSWVHRDEIGSNYYHIHLKTKDWGKYNVN